MRAIRRRRARDLAGWALAGAAEGLVGTPFRLHGREAETGLDCLGLVALALEQIGRSPRVPAGYRLRQLDPERWLAAAGKSGFVVADGREQPGDLLLVRPGPAQFHLVIVARDGGFIEAHAGLGRVVRTPSPLPWPAVRRWRLTG